MDREAVIAIAIGIVVAVLCVGMNFIRAAIGGD